MAAKRKTGSLDQSGESPRKRTESHDDGVSALAQSALDRLAQSSKAIAQNVPKEFLLEADVTAFTNAIIDGNTEFAGQELYRLVETGAKYEWIADTMIAGAARILGARWEQNSLSFIKVSLGISELLRINSELRRRTRGRFVSDGTQAVFVSIRGQAHNLGIILAAEAFRQNGWDVEMMIDSSIDEVVNEVEACKPALVGLTAGRNDRLTDIAKLLERLKALSPAPRTILGGHAVADVGILEMIENVDDVVTSIEDGLVAARRKS